MSESARWWSSPRLRGELDAILGLVSAGRAALRDDEELAARKLCDAANRAWNARARLSDAAPAQSDWQLVKALVSDLRQEEALALLRSSELRELVSIEPAILNHKKLLERGFLGSFTDVPDDVRGQASEAHLRLRRRIEGLSERPDADHIQKALVRVADLLYVIRSNLQHGEKFASGDPARIARDRVIAENAARVLELFFDLAFSMPSTALATYGSLAPGGAHHAQLADVGGQWVPAVVRGQLRDGIFPRLVLSPAAGEIPVQLLRAAHELPKSWQRLDQLEGVSYERVLVRVETQQGELVIANVYAGA
jgi:gamma-glutamylcyclotransferase (GGCT)/AIG2-like uncharacterized protein YtfP